MACEVSASFTTCPSAMITKMWNLTNWFNRVQKYAEFEFDDRNEETKGEEIKYRFLLLDNLDGLANEGTKVGGPRQVNGGHDLGVPGQHLMEGLAGSVREKRENTGKKITGVSVQV